MARGSVIAVSFLLAWLLQPAPASAVVIGQKDMFEDGTTQGWVVGLLGAVHPAPPVNVPTGGPGGVDDNYLLLTAVGGVSAGNRLSVINLAQWTGDFPAAGVNAIRMDVNNLGPDDLSLRLMFADPVVGPPDDIAFSTVAVSLPAQSGWVSVLFPVALSDLTAGLGSVTDALTGATEMRIFHSPTAGIPGPAVIVQLGVDNIQAVGVAPVPEPGTLSLVLGGLSLLAWVRRRR